MGAEATRERIRWPELPPAGVRIQRVTRARVMETVNAVDTTAVRNIPDRLFAPPYRVIPSCQSTKPQSRAISRRRS